MGVVDFLKPNLEKILVLIFIYFIFYLLDYLVLSQVEFFYIPETVTEIISLPSSFWVLRTLSEILSFYLIACVALWTIDSKKLKFSKKLNSIKEYLKPNRVHLITVIIGYFIMRMVDIFLYGPLISYYIPITEGAMESFVVTFVHIFVELTTFYIAAAFALWIRYHKN
ncbi:hypothetical protein HYT02_05705 [Candidatus Gottesmanbacteria bacterium]|nr:hypothetical protein [Candidatus Gottesmanbacteria bacterium]